MLDWLRMMFHRLPGVASADEREASRAACALVKARCDCKIRDVGLRAEEANRWVFAVFFDPGPYYISRPSSYKLVEVDKESGNVQEVSEAEADHYRIRGRK
jgi:hypothetical protein